MKNQHYHFFKLNKNIVLLFLFYRLSDSKVIIPFGVTNAGLTSADIKRKDTI